MAHRKSDDQLLRKVFDATYDEIGHLQQIDQEEVKAKLKRTVRANSRVLTVSMMVIALTVVVIATTYALSLYFDYLAWENRPSFAERVEAPYDLETKLPPYLLNAVLVDAQVDDTVEFVTSNINYYPNSERPNVTYPNSIVVQLQSIVPKTIGNFTLQWDRTQTTLLAECLIQMGAEQTRRCDKPATAEFIESANFKDVDGNKLSLVMTKFATDEEAVAVSEKLYRYARNVGLIGNFALTEMNDVDYFYSATRSASSFTWVNHNWVISVSADSFDTIDAFMIDFPLYENNPELGQIVVEQIQPSTPEPVIVETPVEEDTAEATAELEAVENAEVEPEAGASD